MPDPEPRDNPLPPPKKFSASLKGEDEETEDNNSPKKPDGPEGEGPTTPSFE